MLSASFTSAQEIYNTWEGVERIFVVGDIHGDFEAFETTLEEAGIIKSNGRWNGGNAHLVQMGDIPGYGADTVRIMRFLMELEQEAREAGGRVHVLIGDHEAMAITGDLRQVPDEEFEILTTGKSKKIREDYFEEAYAVTDLTGSSMVSDMIDENLRTNWFEKTPLGYVEHRLLWALDGEFGEWVMSHNAMIKINNILFSHAGLGPDISGDLLSLNNRIRAELAGEYIQYPLLSTHERGPLRYNGHVTGRGLLEELNVDNILEAFDVDHIIAGHTPTGLGVVYPRFNGKLINVDTGISEHFGGYRSSLEIRNGHILIKNMNGNIPLRLPQTPAEEEIYFNIALDQFGENPPLGLVEKVRSYQ